MKTVNVKDFGAVGDGDIDDTLAIQKALNSGSTVLIPNGTYNVKGTITISLKRSKILCPSWNAAIPQERPVPRRREAIEHTRRKLGL